MVSSHTQRKAEHLRICLEQEVEFRFPTTGLDEIQLPHQALPELDLQDINTSVVFLGRRLDAPLLISSMTGGVESARQINRHLAGAAQRLGIALALGSVRAALEDNSLRETYRVRDVAPDIFLCTNLGAVQLNYGYGLSECQRAVDMLEADALILHLNPLQEALQAGGNTNFAGLLQRISEICHSLDVPVIVKEVGWGISGDTARRLLEAGVAAIDVAGAGGTSWSEVEKWRAEDEVTRRLASAFDTWGLPLIQALWETLHAAPGVPVIASGGIRTGVHVAKVLAIGANLAGLALPLLKPAEQSEEAVIAELSAIIQELRIAMFCTGCRTPDALRHLKWSDRRSNRHTPPLEKG